MTRATKVKIFKALAVVFFLAVLAVTVDIMRQTTHPGSKKWGLEAVKEGRETHKKKLRYKHKIEQRIGEADSTEVSE